MEYSLSSPGHPLLDLPWMVVGVLAVAFVTTGWLYARQRRLGRAMQTELDAMTTRIDEAEEAGIPGVVSGQRFDVLLDEAAAACDRGARSLSLLFIHLDNLQTVNDAFGYLCGDKAIALVVERLIAEAGPGAVLGRLGGDAFVLMADATLEEARGLAASVVTVRSGGDGIEPVMVCSVGVANYPLHGSRARVVGHASTAMRAVRQVGGGDFAVFDPSMSVDLKEQTELLRDLRHAVSRGELALVYQPKVDAKTLQITAAEALLRWHHPQRGLISPGIFIPLAERFGLIGPIGNWVIDEACRQAGVWRSAGLRMRVAINISAYQMRQDDLVDRLEAALAANGLSANRFTCEITESVAMEDTKVTHRTFERMPRPACMSRSTTSAWARRACPTCAACRRQS
jgi:diguanylate cyclase (GGDEF)-like protein